MSQWKGDFEGFYKAGLNNGAEAAQAQVDKLVAKFAAALKEMLAPEAVREAAPRYEYTSTKGYRYHI